MKTTHLNFGIFTYSLICISLLILSGTYTFGQEVITDNSLMNKAYKAYSSEQWLQASIYLYAYIQKNPPDISSDINYSKEVCAACDAAFARLKEMGGAKVPLPATYNLLTTDMLFTNANNAIKKKNWANASLYIYAYIQKEGTLGIAINSDIIKKYLQSIEKVNNDIANYSAAMKASIAKQNDNNEDGIASVTSGLGASPPHLRKPKTEIQIDTRPRPLVPKSFNGFADAFQSVVSVYENNFAPYIGTILNQAYNYNTTIVIADSLVKGSNIYLRNNNWSFRFTIEGNASDESNQFNMLKQNIEQAFTNLSIAYTVTSSPYKQGTIALNSITYKSPHLLIAIYPAIFESIFNDDVIITHLQ